MVICVPLSDTGGHPANTVVRSLFQEVLVTVGALCCTEVLYADHDSPAWRFLRLSHPFLARALSCSLVILAALVHQAGREGSGRGVSSGGISFILPCFFMAERRVYSFPFPVLLAHSERFVYSGWFFIHSAQRVELHCLHSLFLRKDFTAKSSLGFTFLHGLHHP